MRERLLGHLPVLGLVTGTLALAACSTDVDTTGSDGSGGDGSTSIGAGGAPSTATSADGSGGGTTSTTSSGPGSGGASGGVADPALDGPYAFTTFDDDVTTAATGHTFAVHVFQPTTGPTAGPYPLVVIAHGFQLPVTQYTSYAERLATFGYVAVTAEYPASAFSPNHVDNALDLLGVIDWAETASQLTGKVDTSNTGLTGHSLGGKVSLLAATKDARVRAVIALDPVDSATSCSPTNCPDVSQLMPGLAIPTGFVGETTDAGGGFMPCAPAADNFTTFYAGATSPSFMVTVTGANHMSFLDDVASCGFTCSFCQPASAPNADVNAMSRAFVTAFFERHLRDLGDYDAYLTGTEATARYVTTGKATIASK